MSHWEASRSWRRKKAGFSLWLQGRACRGIRLVRVKEELFFINTFNIMKHRYIAIRADTPRVHPDAGRRTKAFVVLPERFELSASPYQGSALPLSYGSVRRVANAP